MYRQSVQIGYTDFTEDDVKRIVTELGKQFRGNRYHLMNNNCNHFSGAFTQVLLYLLNSSRISFFKCSKNRVKSELASKLN